MGNEPAIPPIIKDLAEAASRQTGVANKYWISLAVVSLIVIIPHPSSLELQKLPFELGTVERKYFYMITLILVSVLTVSFCSAHAQVLRSHFLFERAIEIYRLMPSTSCPGLHPRDLFDVLRLPVISRVAPLAQIARGKGQFYTDQKDFHWFIKWTTIIYYFLLKLLSICVYIGLPIFALLLSIERYLSVCPIDDSARWPSILLWFIVICASITLLHILINELYYVVNVAKVLYRGKSKK